MESDYSRRKQFLPSMQRRFRNELFQQRARHYGTNNQLKHIGFIIAAFAAGFIIATIGSGSTQYWRTARPQPQHDRRARRRQAPASIPPRTRQVRQRSAPWWR